MNVILTMDNKGGIGKSLDAEMVSSALVGAGYQVARIDTDTSNSSFTTIYPDAKHVSVGEANVKAGGDLAAAILDAADSGADFLIGDTGARDEVRIVAHLAQILEATAQSGGRVIVLRPVNLNLAVHNNAVTFAERFAKDNSVSVLFAPSVACGRSITDFDLVWNSLNSVQKLLSLPNVAQFLIEDLGAVYAENLSLARAPLRAIAAGNFNIALDAPPVIRERLGIIYNRGARLHIAQWLKIHEARVLEALTKVGGMKVSKTVV